MKIKYPGLAPLESYDLNSRQVWFEDYGKTENKIEINSS